MMQKAFISLHILKYVVQVMLEDHADEIGHTKKFCFVISNTKICPKYEVNSRLFWPALIWSSPTVITVAPI